MTVISKELFYEKIGNEVSCHFIHDWKKGCVDATLSPSLMLEIAKGTATFFLPIYIVKFLITYKKKDMKTNILSVLKSELRSIGYGVIMAEIVLSVLCILRKIFGRINYYNTLMIPGFVSGLSVLVESEENQVLDTIIFFNAFVETQLRKLRLDNLKQTLLFMSVSGALMHLLQRRPTEKMGFTHFWFYVPQKKIEAETSTNNGDSLKSRTSLLQSFINYSSLGYGINIIKQLLSKFGVILKKPSELTRVLFNKSNVKFGLFMGGYVTIHRVLNSLLTNNGFIKEKYHGFLTGLLSGTSYIISPNLQIIVIAITTFLQLIYEKLCRKFKITNHYWQRFLLYSLTHGILLHDTLFNPETCSPYYKNMISACSNNLIPRVYGKLFTTYFAT